jgi:hypothetical protein
MADYLDQETVLMGAQFRFLRDTGKVDPDLLSEFSEFVKGYVRRWEPIKREDVDFESYLEQSHYSGAKKEILRDIKKNMICRPTTVRYNGFGKAEFINICPGFESWVHGVYSVFKYVRCINAPDDTWKVYVAPLIHAVEAVVCKDSHFAKYIPVIDRAGVIFERLSKFPGPYYVTDYTSFEASFSPQILNAAEGNLYRHMLQDFNEVDDIVKQMIGWHHIRYRNFSVKVRGTRMSGDCNTSLGNGFTNLMLTSFMCHKLGIDFDGFVEGDDGEFAFSAEPDFSIITRLGFVIKFSPHSTIYTTSFCGLMLSRSLALFSDPVFEVVKFGWTTSQQRHSKKKAVLRGLLRAKALSLFYCHPRCPMLTVMALKFMQLTKSDSPIWASNYWESQLVRETIKYQNRAYSEFALGITPEDREDFERLYGISPQVQICFENYIKTLTSICALDHWTIDEMMRHTLYGRINEHYVR